MCHHICSIVQLQPGRQKHLLLRKYDPRWNYNGLPCIKNVNSKRVSRPYFFISAVPPSWPLSHNAMDYRFGRNDLCVVSSAFLTVRDLTFISWFVRSVLLKIRKDSGFQVPLTQADLPRVISNYFNSAPQREAQPITRLRFAVGARSWIINRGKSAYVKLWMVP